MNSHPAPTHRHHELTRRVIAPEQAASNAIAFSGQPSRLVGAWRRDRAVGIVSPSYGTEKVSYGLMPEAFTFHKLLRIPMQRFERRGTFWTNTPVLLDYPVELVHTFNELPYGIRPFVVSFENELPRYLGDVRPWQMRAGLDLLASDRCRRVLALSEIAARTLKRNLADLGVTEVAAKVSIFRGAVLSMPAVGEREAASRLDGGPLRVLFVGRDAFGKGLLPALDALDECLAQGASIEATVVCNFETRDYISKGRHVDTAALIHRMGRSPHITHHHRLPNRAIHDLMRSHDVLVFPTLDESLGWVAVEAAMAGMPVIATDIYAIPELVLHGKTGFLIPLRKNESARWVGLWMEGAVFDQEVAHTFATIREHLVRHLLHLAENPRLIHAMGLAGKAHMEALYSTSAARRHLAEIYTSAVGV